MKKAAKTTEQLTKEALKVTEKNIAAIEAKERGESPTDAARAKTPAKAASKATTPKNADTAKRGGPGAKTPAKKTPAKKKAATKRESKPAAPKAKKATSSGGERKPGVLDAAVMILKGAKEPMGCQEMIEAMFEKKIWSSDGQTPHATLYAAIIREISAKGKESRFEKVDRGRFQLRVRKGVA